MDKIVLEGLSFFAYHGTNEAERCLGQRFQVDIEIFADLKAAAASDRLEDTVDYHEIYNQIDDAITNQEFSLLEALAEALADRVLSNQLVEKVVLRVKKEQPPIAGKISGVAVEICRERHK